MADETKTTICNQALGRFGSKVLADFDSDTGNEANKCRLFYDPTRKALLRSFVWIFAGARKTLSNAGTPAFGWDNRFALPDDYLSFRYDNTITGSLRIGDRWQIEGNSVFTNSDEVELVYTRDIEDPAVFDPLFVEVFVLTLALKLVYPIAGTTGVTIALHKEIKDDLKVATSKARRISKKENNVSGRSDFNLARLTNRSVFTRQGRVFGR